MCSRVTLRAAAIVIGSLLSAFSSELRAQPLQPGEAFVTRFSGIQSSGPQDNPTVSIDINGTVGSILDIRAPRKPPTGEHWIDEPQRAPVTAGAVGQVFGVALDDANPPNIYLTSTSAFGLHHTPDNQWMPGMWGPGGPSAIYKLTAANGYQPSLFATVTLNGRQNTGAALGNIAFDRTSRQLFVSDLETGMIHRIGLDGRDGGFFDHGTQGRASFTDAQSGQQLQLPPIAFDPNSRARFADCAAPPGDSSPECWNLAANGRRVWGLGVRSEGPGRTRLYYSAWSGPAFDPDSWASLSEEEKRNTVWSVGIGPDGSFAQDVRREFVVPDFFIASEDIARAGYSSPVSDISFPVCSARPVMLIAERGGMRNLGLAAENSFANPHEARTIRLELDTTGAWRPVGRYDIGFYDRQKDGLPFLRANCAGGVAFGPGYSNGEVNQGAPDQFVWITGDSLCSPDGPCNLPPGAAAQPAGGAQQVAQQSEGDDSEVHGLQGMSEAAIGELAPAAAFQETPTDANATASARGPNEAYLIDTDINVDASGNPIEAEFLRNDATLIGDVAIYEICQGPPPPQESFALLPAPPPQIPDEPITWAGHPADISHAQFSSHGRDMSHFRWGSHFARMSHRRWQSHAPFWSHNWVMSGWHNTYWSHWPRLSHRRWGSDRHWRTLSPPHSVFLSPRHWTNLSPRHQRFLSPRHIRPLSPGHYRLFSPGHRLPLSPHHNLRLSPGHQRPLSPYHNHILSKQKHKHPLSVNLHDRRQSPGQHKHAISLRVPGLQPVHNRVLSPKDKPAHNRQLSPATTKPGHDRHLSQNKPIHNRALSPGVKPTPSPHSPRLSNAQKPGHSQQQSNAQKPKPHNQRLSNAQKPGHSQRQSDAQKPKAHNQRQSNAQKPKAHNQRQSNAQKPKAHNQRQSNAQKPKAHNQRQSNAQKPKAHSPRLSNAQKPKAQKPKAQKQKQQVQKQRPQAQKQQNKPRQQKRHNQRTSRPG